MGKVRMLFVWVKENQNGLFKIAVLILLLYWTSIFKSISDAIPYTADIESQLSNIESAISDLRR